MRCIASSTAVNEFAIKKCGHCVRQRQPQLTDVILRVTFDFDRRFSVGRKLRSAIVVNSARSKDNFNDCQNVIWAFSANASVNLAE